MKKVSDYYTGGELIDRLGILAIDLVGAIIRQIVPYPTSEVDGTFRTPESDPALYDPTVCESPQAWVEQIRAAKFFKPFVQVAMPRIMAELGTCWELDPAGTIHCQEVIKSENSPKRRIINNSNKEEFLAASRAAEEQMTEEERQQVDLKYEALIKRYGLFENPFARLKAAQEADEVRFSTMMKGVSPMPRGEEVAPAVPRFATASDLVAYYQGREVEGRKIHELQELARLVDEEFTETARLTDEALGRLLPANPGAEISAEGHKRQGHRLRKAYQQKR